MDATDEPKIERAKPTRLSKAEVRKMFFESPFLEWAPFATKQNWTISASRQKYPTAQWVDEKRRRVAFDQAELLSESVFQHNKRYFDDVFKTLKVYPETNDLMLGLLQLKMNRFVALAQEPIKDENGKTIAPGIDRIDSQELRVVAGALKAVTEAKMKSLLLTDETVRVAIEVNQNNRVNPPDADPNVKLSEEEIKRAQEAQEQEKANTFTFTLLDGKPVSTSEVEALVSKFYDPPIRPIEEPEPLQILGEEDAYNQERDET